jgi:membrane-associated phospholipid phosphatase
MRLRLGGYRVYAVRLLVLAAVGLGSYAAYYAARLVAARGGVVEAYYGGLAWLGERLLGAPVALVAAQHWSHPVWALLFLVYTLHPALMAAVAAAAALLDEKTYWETVASMAIVAGVAAGIYAVLPTAPPWMALPGLPREARVLLKLGGDPDPYASFPSLHVGYAVLTGYYLLRLLPPRRRLARLLAASWPAFMSASVLYTANHYLADVVGAIALSSASIAATRWLADAAWRKAG